MVPVLKTHPQACLQNVAKHQVIGQIFHLYLDFLENISIYCCLVMTEKRIEMNQVIYCYKSNINVQYTLIV